MDNHPEWLVDLYDVVEDIDEGWLTITKPQRFTLTTAHLDHNPANCVGGACACTYRSNLKALCTICHLNLDRDDWNRTRKAREMKQRERHGQLTLDFNIGGDE